MKKEFQRNFLKRGISTCSCNEEKIRETFDFRVAIDRNDGSMRPLGGGLLSMKKTCWMKMVREN